MLVVVLILALKVILGWYKIASPDEALAISGKSKDTKYLVGSGSLVIPVVQKVNGRLSLAMRTLDVVVRDVMTIEAVKIDVEAVAQIKIGTDEEHLRTAGAAWLGKTDQEMNEAIRETLGGHLRSIIAEMTAEAAFKDRQGFSDKVLETSKTDLEKMGLTIPSFVIREISDQQGYFDALGAPQIANTKRTAEIASAEARRSSREAVASAELQGSQAEIKAQTQQAEAEKERDVQKAGFKKTADTARAEAEMAHSLKTAEINKALTLNEGNVEVERQTQLAAAAEVAIKVAEQNQQATIVIPAQKKKDADIALAEGEARAITIRAEAEASRIVATKTAAAKGFQLEGEAEANVNKTKLLAAAEGNKETLLAQATGSEATLLAEAAGTRAKLLAEADGIGAKLNAQAEGEAKLATARSSQQEVNFRLDAIKVLTDGKVRVADAIAKGVQNLGANMKVVQIGNGSNGNGNGSGNAIVNAVKGIPEFITEIDAKSDALLGFRPGDILGNIFNRGKNGSEKESPLTHENEKVLSSSTQPVLATGSEVSDEETS